MKAIGIEEGKEIGAKENSIAIAKKMLAKNQSLEDIIELIELSAEEIQNIF